MPALKEELDQKLDELFSAIPDDAKKKMEEGQKEIDKMNIEKNARKKGNPIPMFGLKNTSGKKIESAELLKKGPVVISFYRGGWCPFCNLEMAALHDAIPEFEKLGASFIAISPELPEYAAETAANFGLNTEILVDTDNKVANLFGLVFQLPEVLRPVYKDLGIDIPFRNGNESYEIPVPGTYVVDQNGIIVESFIDPDYSKRMEPDKIIETLKKL